MDTDQRVQEGAIDNKTPNLQTEVFQELESEPQAIERESYKSLYVFGGVFALMIIGGAYWYVALSSTEIPGPDAPSKFLNIGVDMGEVYTDAKYDFSITPPRDWTSSEGQMGALVFFYESQSGNESFKTNINIVRELVAKDTNTQNYVSTSIEQMSKVLTDYKAMSIDKVKIAAGEEGYRVVGIFKMGNVVIMNSQLYLVKGGEAYVVTGTSRKENWAGNKLAFDSTFSTFKVGESN